MFTEGRRGSDKGANQPRVKTFTKNLAILILDEAANTEGRRGLVKGVDQPSVKAGHIDIKVEVKVGAAHRGKKRVGKIKNCPHRLAGSSHNPPHLSN